MLPHLRFHLLALLFELGVHKRCAGVLGRRPSRHHASRSIPTTTTVLIIVIGSEQTRH